MKTIIHQVFFKIKKNRSNFNNLIGSPIYQPQNDLPPIPKTIREDTPKRQNTVSNKKTRKVK
jgi:hypothetical protein